MVKKVKTDLPEQAQEGAPRQSTLAECNAMLFAALAASTADAEPAPSEEPVPVDDGMIAKPIKGGGIEEQPTE
jgi:hypothetical protein